MKLGLQIDDNDRKCSAVYKNHNPTLYITELSPINHFFIMVASPGHMLDSTKGIEIKLVHTQMLMKGSTEDQDHNPILHFT